MNRRFNTGQSALQTVVLALAVATVTLALGGFGSGCGSKTTQQLNNRGRLVLAQVDSQTNNGDASADTQNQIPTIDPTPTSGPKNNPTPLPMSNLTWDGKSNLGTADLQVVPLN